jgi:phenylalanyl-tRNA synthetase beta chain
LANALDATQGWMRTSLLPGLIATAARNRSRGLTDLAIFETGLVFLPKTGVTYGQEVVAGGVRPAPEVEAKLYAGIPPQPRYISGLFVGDAQSKQPGQKALAYDWQDALAAVQQIALGSGVAITVRQGRHKAFHPGRTAELILGDVVVGYAGELMPAVAEEAHLPHTVAAFELNLDAVTDAAGVPHTAVDIRTMPAATQDLSLVVSSDIPAAEVLAAVVEGAGELLEQGTLVDVYEGAGIPQGQRSLTFALRFRADDRTLTAAEATASKEAGVALAAVRCGATIRE